MAGVAFEDDLEVVCRHSEGEGGELLEQTGDRLSPLLSKSHRHPSLCLHLTHLGWRHESRLPPTPDISPQTSHSVRLLLSTSDAYLTVLLSTTSASWRRACCINSLVSFHAAQLVLHHPYRLTALLFETTLAQTPCHTGDIYTMLLHLASPVSFDLYTCTGHSTRYACRQDKRSTCECGYESDSHDAKPCCDGAGKLCMPTCYDAQKQLMRLGQKSFGDRGVASRALNGKLISSLTCKSIYPPPGVDLASFVLPGLSNAATEIQLFRD